MEGDGGSEVRPPEGPTSPDNDVTKKLGKPVDHINRNSAVVPPKSKTLAKKMSSIRKMSLTDGERVEVDKTALEAILGVSSSIAGIQRRSRLSMSTLVAHESYKD
ncbi:hypothetical protein B5X24_HaOG204754 [Helicoverpa armigera]|uniref:Uncharacterized protein n=1 Tax=Helicoverpa armigera TaxID=29058 RepID=A0A2W1BT52_HELAM|nr:hypothetical protein B5X24_HaOG204754 [Helicoverpa armigera]